MSTSTPSTVKAASVVQRTASNVTETACPTAPALDKVSQIPARSVRPVEELEVEESTPAADDVQYPAGAQLWLNMIAVTLVCFLHGLDLTIVAVAVPKLTNQFNTLADIGWYSAIYGLVMSAMIFLFGKIYTLFSLKWVFIASVAIFELGSILCTFAPTSKVFILGRAVAGAGAAGQGAGAMTVIPRCFPNEKRALMNGLLGFAQSFGLVSAPIIGGALTDAFTWRACFGINVPIGAVAVVVIAFCLKDPTTNPDHALPILEKFKRLDLAGTALIMPSTVCLLIALQWGGTHLGWNDWRIIMLFCIFAGLLVGFGYLQHRQQERAVLPPRLMKNRTVLSGALFSMCTNGMLGVTEYYIAIYFQGVRGYTATRAGLLGLPMIVGLTITSISSAVGQTWLGYYTPFMVCTCILAPIASGLMTTLDLDDSPVKVAALLGFLGAAVGFGNQTPYTATMTVIDPKEVSIALGVLGFGAGMGSSLFVAGSAALFQDRLTAEIAQSAPGTNVTGLGSHGLSDIRTTIGADRLKDVLFGYNEAVVQTLFVPLGLALLTIVATIFTEHKSIKKKAD